MTSHHSLAETDEAAIRSIVQQMMNGWNAYNADEFAAPFSEDADYIVVNGRHVKGRAAIRDGHEEIFNSLYSNSHNEYSVEQVRLLQEDIALAHVRARLVYYWEEKERVGHARIGLVLLKDAGNWQVAAFQNTPIQHL